MRNNQWLAERLEQIRSLYFSDVPIHNTILVRFGRKSRSRFGSIVAKKHANYILPVTYISINSLFRDEQVPEFVIEATLAHEFSHYTHGFHSPLEQKYKFPHQGNVVDKEIRKRGAGHLLDQQKKWIKESYRPFLREHGLL